MSDPVTCVGELLCPHCLVIQCPTPVVGSDGILQCPECLETFWFRSARTDYYTSRKVER